MPRSAVSTPGPPGRAHFDAYEVVEWRESHAADADRPHAACEVSRSRFHKDLDEWGPMLRDDLFGVVGDPWNLTLLGTSLGGSIAIRQDLDGRVRDDTAANPERWGDGSRIVGHFGEAPVQIPALLGVYWLSLERKDERLHEFSRSAISAYTIMGLSTLAVKGATDTDRPTDDWNNGRWGFPSFHAASTATIAGVVDEHYGTARALPFYALAGAVAWTRIDERDHDLSDVVFGTAMGYVVGKSVARRHREGNSRVRVAPWVHPTEDATGLMWTIDF